ncbi:MAG: hypothetical protein ABW220_06025 [Burkholderiaceae bacterium]
MISTMKRILVALTVCLPLAAGSAWAAPESEAVVDPNKATRAAERDRIEKTYQATVAECRQRFAVTTCEREARAERIRALRPLDREQKDVADLERQRRAAAQRERLQEKDRAAAADESQRRTATVREADRQASAPTLPPAKAPRANPEMHQRQRLAAEAADRRKAAERRQAAIERREKIEERQRLAVAQQRAKAASAAERKGAAASAPAGKASGKPANVKPPAASLPIPSASDIKAIPAP